MAPEILRGKKNTKESDIYSVGMLIWEIFSGYSPFKDKAHSPGLILKICKGLRPPIPTAIPEGYAEMMQKCWHDDPTKRPTIKELRIFAENHPISEDLNNEFIAHIISNSVNDDRRSRRRSHQLAYNSSRILDDDIAKSKELKIYTSNDSSLNDLDIDFITLNINLNKGKLKIRLIENCYC